MKVECLLSNFSVTKYKKPQMLTWISSTIQCLQCWGLARWNGRGGNKKSTNQFVQRKTRLITIVIGQMFWALRKGSDWLENINSNYFSIKMFFSSIKLIQKCPISISHYEFDWKRPILIETNKLHNITHTGLPLYILCTFHINYTLTKGNSVQRFNMKQWAGDTTMHTY